MACPIALSVSGAKAKAPAVYTLIDNETQADGSVARAYYLGEDGERIDIPAPDAYVEAAASTNLPVSYDLRKFGNVTPVRNQGTACSCWAFSMLGAFESNYVLRGYGAAASTDFSERHLVNFSLRQRVSDAASPIYMDGAYYDSPFEYGGSWRNAANALLSGVGAAEESDAPWILTYNINDLSRMILPESERFRAAAHLLDAQQINSLSAAGIKQWIMENGGVVMSYYDDSYGLDSGGSYSYTDAYYQKATKNYINHVVTVVGWDDNYAVSNFKSGCRPQKPGAWLCKNSWGSTWRQSGYFWMSYEEPSISEYIGITSAKGDLFDNIYCYDGANTTAVYDSERGFGSFANVFTAAGNETLTHVAFYNPNVTSVDAHVTVYKGKPTSAYDPTAGCTLQPGETVCRDVLYGYKTVQLDTPVQLKMGETFTVVVTFTGDPNGKVLIPFEGLTKQKPGAMDFTYASRPGQSFVCINSAWYDNTDWWGENHNNVPIKAMTKNLSGSAGTAAAISVTSLPDQVSYFVGDTIDLTGLKITASFSDGTTAPVSGYSVHPSKFTQYGEIPVTITAVVGGKTLKTTFNVYVDPVILVHVTAENVSPQAGLLANGMPDLSGVRLRAYYSNGTTELVTGYQTTTQKQADGSVLVTLSYTADGVTQKTSFTVAGSNDKLVSVTLNGAGTLWTNTTASYSALVRTNGNPTYSVVWSSSNPAVFTVSQNGTVHAVGEGIATLAAEVTAADGQKLRATMHIQVSTAKVTSLTVNGANHLLAGETAVYTASVSTNGSPSYSVKWSSSDPSVLSVEQNGSVRAVGEGTASVIASATDAQGNTVKNSISVSVTASAVTGVSIGGARNLRVGENLTLTANVTMTGKPAYRVAWSGSDSSVLTVSQNGAVRAVGAGAATVYVSVTDASGNVVSASVQLRVTADSVQSVALSGDTSINYKNSGKLNAQVSVTGSPQYTVSWRSSDSGIVSVDQNGKIEGRKQGSAVITATVTESSGKTVESSVTVSVGYAWWQKLIIYVLFGFIWYV